MTMDIDNRYEIQYVLDFTQIIDAVVITTLI